MELSPPILTGYGVLAAMVVVNWWIIRRWISKWEDQIMAHNDRLNAHDERIAVHDEKHRNVHETLRDLKQEVSDGFKGVNGRLDNVSNNRASNQ